MGMFMFLPCMIGCREHFIDAAVGNRYAMLKLELESELSFHVSTA